MAKAANKFRIWTGPTLVNSVADILTKNHVHVLCRGTQHVYVETCYSREIMPTKLPGWSLKYFERL